MLEGFRIEGILVRLADARAQLDAAEATLRAVLEEARSTGAIPVELPRVSPNEHLREHRPGRRARLAGDPELRSFVEARLGAMTFMEIARETLAAFGPERAVRKSAIADWWKKKFRRAK